MSTPFQLLYQNRKLALGPLMILIECQYNAICSFLVDDVSNFWSSHSTLSIVKNIKLNIIGFWLIPVGWQIKKGLDLEPSKSCTLFPKNNVHDHVN